jgi:hypothetical protein
MSTVDISKLISSGYKPEEILSILSKSLPGLGDKLQYAMQAGYTLEDIMRYLSMTGIKSLKNLNSDSSDQTKGMTELEKARFHSKEGGDTGRTAKRLAGIIGPIAGAAGGGYLASRALQAVPQVINNPLIKNTIQAIGSKIAGPSSPQQTRPPIQPLENPNEQMEELNIEPLDISAQKSIPQQIEQKGLEQEELSSEQILRDLGVENRVQSMLQANNNPEVVAGVIEKTINPEQRQALKSKTQHPLESLIADYAAKYKPEIPENFSGLVITPKGDIAKLNNIEKNGIARVDVDGKEKLYKDVDLIKPDQDIQTAFQNFIDLIPEEERSSVVAFTSYNPENEMLAVQFHNGDFYIYPNANQEDIDEILSQAVPAKTTGSNRYAAWKEGEKSRGATLNTLLRTKFKNYIKFSAKDGYDFLQRVRKKNEKKK